MTDKRIDQFHDRLRASRTGYAGRAFWRSGSYDLRLMEKGGLLIGKQDESGYIDRFRDRVMFPIWNRDGKVIAIRRPDARRRTAEIFEFSGDDAVQQKPRILYNFHHARAAIRKSRRVVLFEGYMDVVKAWECRRSNGVASMGTSFTEEHAAMLQRESRTRRSCATTATMPDKRRRSRPLPILEKAGLRGESRDAARKAWIRTNLSEQNGAACVRPGNYRTAGFRHKI